MDSLYWNATLRMDIDSHYHRNSTGENGGRSVSMTDVNKDSILERVADTHYIYSSGLVACSLYGNCFSSAGLLALARALRKNCWLLGLFTDVLCEQHFFCAT
jgi:hypothetical protein